MMEAYLGSVNPVAFNFAPKGWLTCDGQLLPINQNQALYAVLGTSFGGDGVTSFAIPNLRGRAPVGTGKDTSGNTFFIGQSSGSETATMTLANLPAHTHNGNIMMTTAASSQAGELPTTEGAAMGSSTDNAFSTNANATFGPAALTANIATAGAGAGFSVLMPYTVINYIICINGIFPSRD